MHEKNHTVLIAGGAGFLGHHLIKYILEKTDWNIVSLDRLDVSGNLNRIHEVLSDAPGSKDRLKIVFHDLKAPINDHVSKDMGEIEYVVHMAASSHVDRSIEDPRSFVMDNVLGTCNILEWARFHKPLKKFINFSTDEVYGPAPEGYAHKEGEPHCPSNPYAASKSGQETLGYSYFVTYGFPIITTHTMNNFGERQHPEKLIPKTISSVLNEEEMPIFAELDESGKLQAVGSRYWIYAQDTASAVVFLLDNGTVGEEYNIIGFDELSNLDIATKASEIIGKELKPKFVDFHKTRPGHDRRYALDGTKMAQMGWKPEVGFQEGLERTVKFSLANDQWL